jgi:cell fate regulator YaaT (PSP1 superfamily)
MPLVVGVSFKRAGKVYYFDPNGIELHEGESVIAETARGIEFGEVLIEPKEVTEKEIVAPLKMIVRKATPSDITREESNRQKEKNAFHVCQQKIHQHDLPMKLIDAEYCFDSSQVTFFFSAEARVDFRDLVKDLAGALRTKVQLHQVGVRDEAKLFGGMGPCGRALCCASFLNGFEPVSMKMAKEQSLFLNPLKFSGICGKLMCCLKYEYQIYKDAKDHLPGMGSFIATPKGQAKVIEVNVIKETFAALYEDGSVERYTVEDREEWAQAAKSGCGQCCGGTCEHKTAEPETQAVPASETPSETPAPETPSEQAPPATPEAAASETAGEEQEKKRRPRRRPNRRRRRSNKENTEGGAETTSPPDQS